MAEVTTQVPDAGTPIFDAKGYVNPVWHEFFFTMLRRTGGTEGTDAEDVSGRVVVLERRVTDAEKTDASVAAPTHGNQYDPDLHELATQAANGFMSATDKQVVDSLSGSGSNLLEWQYSLLTSATLPTLQLVGNTAASIAAAASIGGFAYRFTTTNTTTSSYVMMAPTGAVADRGMPVLPGSYIVSFYALSSVAGHQVRAEISTFFNNQSANITLTTARTRYAVEIVVSDDQKGAFRLYTNISGVLGRLVTIDSIMVERRTGASVAASAFTPGPVPKADKIKIDGIVAGAAVASVSGTTPIVSSGGSTPAISIAPATAVAAGSMSAADKAKLDSFTYSEGAWTPVLTFATPGDLAVAYTTQAGTWTRIGRVVTFNFVIQTSTLTFTTSAGALQVTGLPFNLSGIAQTPGKLDWQGITKAGYTEIAAVMLAGGSSIQFLASGSTMTRSNIVPGNVVSGTQVFLSCSMTIIA